MTKVPVRVINLEDLLRAEHDENFERLDFLPSESVAIKRALEPIERTRASERLREAGRLGGQTAGRGERPMTPERRTVRGHYPYLSSMIDLVTSGLILLSSKDYWIPI